MTTTTTTMAYYFNVADPIRKSSEMVRNGCAIDLHVAFVNDMISATFRTWIPFGIIFVFNFKAIACVRESRRRARSVTINNNNSTNHNRREREFFLTMIRMSALFFVCHFPLSISWIVVNCYRTLWISASPIVIAHLNMFNRISLLISYWYLSSTLLINILFNKLFRRRLFSYFYCRHQHQ